MLHKSNIKSAFKYRSNINSTQKNQFNRQYMCISISYNMLFMNHDRDGKILVKAEYDEHTII